jgi:AraC-like DNA-binding protein
MNLISVIAGSGAILGIILIAALLLSRNGNQSANRILALFMAALTIYLLSLIFIHNQWATHHNILVLGGGMLFLNGPLLYGYVRAMTTQIVRLRLADTIHLLPLLLMLAYELFFRSGPLDISESLRQSRGGWPPTALSVIGLAYYLLLVLYCMASLRLLRGHQRTIRDQFSSLQGINLRWLRGLCRMCLLIAVLGLIIALLRLAPGFELWPRGIYSMLLMMAVFYVIAFMGVAQPQIFLEASVLTEGDDNEVIHALSPAQYKTSSLDVSQAQECWQRLQEYLGTHKPYVRNELKIADLADMVDMPVNHLSQAINQVAQVNFFNLIKGYRVKEARELLANSSASISNIALDAGFNSESAFYKHFKQATGMTPRRYRKAHAPAPESA